MKVIERVLKFLKTFWVELTIIIAGILVDQISKAIVFDRVGLGNSVTLIPKFLHVTAVENIGAAFSILEGQTWFFILTASLASIGFSIYLFYKKNNSKLFTISMPMIISGTIGNLIDRIFNNGAVRDFIHVEYFGKEIFGSTDFAIFNGADSLLVVGVIVFCVYFIFFHKEEKKPKADEVAAIPQIDEDFVEKGEDE